VRKEKKSWTHEGPRKKWKKIAMSTKESRERERIMQKWSYNKSDGNN
jgi:hypothetical protein